MSASTPGCTGCGSKHTATLDVAHGRRCAACPPGFSPTHYDRLTADGRDPGPYLRTLLTLPPGGYQPELAGHMVDLGRPHAAFAYLAAWLRAEADRRFTEALPR